MASADQTPFTVAFYDPRIKAKDDEGRTLDDILAFSDYELESHHDFIQYLFPLPERSPINPYAPVINKATRDAFLQRPELRKEVFRSVVLMARFYGFEVNISDFSPSETNSNSDSTENGTGDGKKSIFLLSSPSTARWNRNSRLWRTRFSHNHLRITRIIRCLRVLGMEALAQGFHQMLLACDVKDAISARTKIFWERAARRGLHLAPEEEDEEASGVAWLREEANAEREDGIVDGGFDAESGRMAVLVADEVGEV